MDCASARSASGGSFLAFLASLSSVDALEAVNDDLEALDAERIVCPRNGAGELFPRCWGQAGSLDQAQILRPASGGKGRLAGVAGMRAKSQL